MRLGILQFGTVQWVADETVTLTNTDAGRVALMARAASAPKLTPKSSSGSGVAPYSPSVAGKGSATCDSEYTSRG